MRNSVTPPRSERSHGDQACQYCPRCPGALAPDRIAASAIASHFEQGWSLLCHEDCYRAGTAGSSSRACAAGGSAGMA